MPPDFFNRLPVASGWQYNRRMATFPIEATARWTIADVELLDREEGKRYEVIEGDLFVSTQPDWHHQETCNNIAVELTIWTRGSAGGKVLPAPGVIFDEENAVAPDVVWISAERLALVLSDDGKLHEAPDLAIEVVSPGTRNARRDREAKLRLYSTRGVREYWIVDWQAGSLQIYRRELAALKLVATLLPEDELTSPLLPGFKVTIARLLPG
jgi:Uma2 family endonuclease